MHQNNEKLKIKINKMWILAFYLFIYLAFYDYLNVKSLTSR